MSEYRRALQDALIARRRAGGISPERSEPRSGRYAGCPPYQRFYSVCSVVACAAFLSGWLLAILAHV